MASGSSLGRACPSCRDLRGRTAHGPTCGSGGGADEQGQRGEGDCVGMEQQLRAQGLPRAGPPSTRDPGSGLAFRRSHLRKRRSAGSRRDRVSDVQMPGRSAVPVLR
jgi:hypothetical protein